MLALLPVVVRVWGAASAATPGYPSHPTPNAPAASAADGQVGAWGVEAHMQADRGACPPGSQLDEVTHLVAQEQAVAAAFRAPPDPPGQRVDDPPAVV